MASEAANTSTASDTGSKPNSFSRGARKPRSSGSAADAAKAFAFANPGLQGPRPGAFPVIFPTGAGTPVEEEFFDLKAHQFLRHITQLFSELRMHPELDPVAFYARPSDSDGWKDDYEEMFQAAGLGALMQQVVEAHRTMEESTGDTSAVYGPGLPVSSLIRTVCSQYGEFNIPDIGVRYRLTDYMATMRRLGRMLQSQLDGDGQDEVESAYFFPSSVDDKSLDFIIARGTRVIVKRHLGADPQEFTAFPTSQPSWAAPLISILGTQPQTAEAAEDLPAIQFVLGARPTTAAGYQRGAYYRLICMAGGPAPPNDPAAHDFVSRNAFKEAMTALTERWTSFQPYEARWLTIQDRALLKGAVGSVSQLFSFVDRGNLHRAEGPVGASGHELSLGVIYPPTCIVQVDRPRTNIHTVDLSVPSLMKRWVTTGVKKGIV